MWSRGQRNYTGCLHHITASTSRCHGGAAASFHLHLSNAFGRICHDIRHLVVDSCDVGRTKQATLVLYIFDAEWLEVTPLLTLTHMHTRLLTFLEGP